MYLGSITISKVTEILFLLKYTQKYHITSE